MTCEAKYWRRKEKKIEAKSGKTRCEAKKGEDELWGKLLKNEMRSKKNARQKIMG